MLKIFTLKFEEKSESFNDTAMHNFLTDKDILRWESNFFERKNEYFWTVLIEYRQSIPLQTEIRHKVGESKDESYKELLKESDFPLFKELREWRAEHSKKDGIPPYIICNNMQLARITVARPLSLNALQEIEGIGKAKAEKYGKELLQIIASHGQQVSVQKEEKNG
jgi:superfamily II DNA helicase RecQ